MARGRGGVTRVSWFLAFVGFALLVILHELGHFTAAKAVGMRVEKFSLFFPPTLWSKKVGETEYAIGSIPRGRLREDQRDEPGRGPPRGGPRPRLPRAAGLEADRGDRGGAGGEPRAGLRAAVRLLLRDRAARPTTSDVGTSRRATRPRGVLKPGDRLVAVDGQRRRRRRRSRSRSPAHKCAAEAADDGCKAAEPVPAHGRARRRARARSGSRPIYDPAAEAHAARLRLRAPGPREDLRVGEAFDLTADRFWFITKETLELPARLINPEQRKEISGVVGLLRGHAPDDPQRRGRRGRDPRDHLAVAGDREPVPVPAAGRRPHLLGDRREGAAQAGAARA